jgi:hypothetical protein
LKPHRLRPLGDDVVDVSRDVARATEDVDEVDVARDVGDAAVDALAEDLGDVGVIHGHGDDVAARALCVLRDVERWLP